MAAAVKPLLKQAKVQDYPDSYYDETSSHYMGGAHNAALATLKGGKIPEQGKPASYYDVTSPHYQGGAHNVALNRLKEESKRRVESASQSSYMKLLGDIYRSKANRPVTQAQFEQNATRVGEFVAFVICGGLCMAFYVNFKTYHASLQKLEKLTELFNNPKARVASGEQGQRIMKKLQQAKTPEAKKPAASELDLTLKKVSDLLSSQQQAAPPKRLQQAYQPPQFVDLPTAYTTPSYQLQEPIIGTEPLLSNFQKLAPQQASFNGYPQVQMQRQAPVQQYPQLFQPAGFQMQPQMMPQMMAMQPQMMMPQQQLFQPARQELSKSDLARILLAMIAKDQDLEA